MQLAGTRSNLITLQVILEVAAHTKPSWMSDYVQL